MMSEEERFAELLNSAHAFPAAVMIKVIGKNRPEFIDDVIFATEQHLSIRNELQVSTRFTLHERHVAITLEPFFQDAEEVVGLYARLRSIEGVVLLM